MDCKDVCKWMCAYLDGEIEPNIKRSIDEHIANCTKCKKEIETCVAFKKLIHEKLCSISAPENLKKKILTELSAIDEYRESGIQALDLIRWGSHIAQIYEAKEDLFEILVPYLLKGLEQNERCIWIVSDISQDEAISALKKYLPDLYQYIEKGQLDIINYKDWYLLRGFFDGQCVLNDGFKKCEEAESEGYSGLRVTATTAWLEPKDWELFMEYEKMLNSRIADSKQLVICTYRADRCKGNKICDIINNHKYVISKKNGSWKVKKY